MYIVYEPEDLYYDAAYTEDGYIEVFLLPKTDLEHDCLDTSQISYLPSWLSYAAENQWTTDKCPIVKMARVKEVLEELGYEYRKIIDWHPITMDNWKN